MLIHVTDVNDNLPDIRLVHPPRPPAAGGAVALAVSAHARAGRPVTHLSATDRDSADNGRVTCWLGGDDLGGLFDLRRLRHGRGQYSVTVSGARRLDTDRRRRYDMTLTCADHGRPPRVSTLAMSVTVRDHSQHQPPHFAADPVVTSSLRHEEDS